MVRQSRTGSEVRGPVVIGKVRQSRHGVYRRDRVRYGRAVVDRMGVEVLGLAWQSRNGEVAKGHKR